MQPMLIEQLDLPARLRAALAGRMPAPLEQCLLDSLSRFSARTHGDYARWAAAINAFPAAAGVSLSAGAELSAVTLAAAEPPDLAALATELRTLMPWRKGPFDLFGLAIDTEWRSDWKWARLANAVDWAKAQVLDVGCGNGYFGWRMLDAGAGQVIGIDPTLLFCLQHLAIDRYARDSRNWVLPLALEELPAQRGCQLEFDIATSLGVIYHRRDPIDHLATLFRCLRPGGTLLLESLVVEHGPDLAPGVDKQRYAQMRNVWNVPRVATLSAWLKQAGFTAIECLDVTATSVDEQRATDWMRFDSLPDFLDAADPSRTVEGWPAPTRALLRGVRPN